MISRYAKDIAKEYTASYAGYVASNRAVPALIDGLKPVHRRCINSAYDLKLFHDKKFLKVAKLSGQVLGDYHPHGGASMVLLAQPFKTRYPLFEGQGNFGCPDSPNSVAAERYIETRLTKFCEDFYLESADYADKEDNYDGRLKETTLYYPPLPGVMFTSSSGIAVGFSTNIPAHTIKDVGESLLSYIRGEDYLKDIMPETCEESIVLTDRSDIKKLYEKGEGSVRYRAKTHYETIDGSPALVVDAFPPGFSKKTLETPFILESVEKGLLELNNESSDNIRYVFTSSDKSILDSVLERLESSVSYRFYIEHRGVIHLYKLSEIYDTFIEEKCKYIVRKYDKLLRKESHELEYLDALLKLKYDKEFIRSMIDMSSTQAKHELMERYFIDSIIAERVLSVSLRSLMSDNIEKIKVNIKELTDRIAEHKDFVENPMTKLIYDIEKITEEYKKEKRRAVHFKDQNDSFRLKYKGRSRVFYRDTQYIVGSPNNTYEIVYGESLKFIDLSDKYVLPADKEFYVFYDRQGLVSLTKELVLRGDNKFRSDSLLGIVGTNSLEDVTFKSSKGKLYKLGDWSIRTRLSYVKLVDGDITIELTEET